jgi:hypothetical protein
MSGIEQRPEGLVKLSGTIRNYKVIRASANFVFTDSDKTKLGVVAIAAGLAGLSGQAISTASSAATEENADCVEFDLNGKPVKGWVWRSPFKEGDVVDVAAEWQGDHYEAGGIARPIDHMIALYPHCSRGTARHVKNGAKWGVIFILLFLLMVEMMGVASRGIGKYSNEVLSMPHLLVALGVVCFFMLMVVSMIRKWMVFVRLAEKVFRTLDLPDPSNIDLVNSSKAQRKPDDSGEFGTFYFRY